MPRPNGQPWTVDLLPPLYREDIRAEMERLRGALDEVLTAFSRMPDAGLKPNDPRYAWWYETAEARKRGREALAAASRTQEPSS